MPLKITPPIQSSHILAKTDAHFGSTKGGSTSIMVRQASTGDVERRDDLFAEFKKTLGKNGDLTLVQRLSWNEIRRVQVFLTLAACNIIDETGEPLFVFDNNRLPNEVIFNRQWSKLDPIVSAEIAELVVKTNPMWTNTFEESNTAPVVTTGTQEGQPTNGELEKGDPGEGGS